MKSKLAELDSNIKDCINRLETLKEGYFAFDAIKRTYTNFKIMFEQERAELLSKLGRK